MLKKYTMIDNITVNCFKGFATLWEFSFYRQKKVANYEFYILFAEKIHLHSYFFIFYVLKPRSFSSNPTLKGFATFWEF